MNKKVLIKRISKETGYRQEDVSEIFNAAIKEMVRELTKGAGQIQLLGFGTLSTVIRPEKIGRHPKTGDAIKIPPSLVVRFKAGSVLKRGLEERMVRQCGSDMGTRSVFLT